MRVHERLPHGVLLMTAIIGGLVTTAALVLLFFATLALLVLWVRVTVAFIRAVWNWRRK